MYDRILVPMDGSDVAERVLPHVEALAEKFGSTVILVHAVTPPESLMGASAEAAGTFTDPTPIVEAEREEMGRYLEALAGRLGRAGLRIESELVEGPTVEAITERAGASETDLIAMTTHGRGGLGRLIIGSIADRISRHAPCPVLLVRVRE